MAADERGSDWRAALAGLRQQLGRAIPVHEPLVVCLPDDASVFRWLQLPHADEAATQAMVQAQLCEPAQASVAILDVGSRGTTLCVTRGDRVAACAVFDEGPEHWLEAGQDAFDPEALRGWAERLREMYDAAVARLAAEQRPRQCVLVGQAGALPGVAAAVREVVGLEVRTPALSRLAADAPAPPLEAFAAIGAALCALAEDATTLNLAEADEEAPAGASA